MQRREFHVFARNRSPNPPSTPKPNSNSGGWSPTGSTRHVDHQLAYCTCSGWLWGWRIWWNDDWHGKLKYSEKTCPSATLSTTNQTWPYRARTRAAAVGNQRLPRSLNSTILPERTAGIHKSDFEALKFIDWLLQINASQVWFPLI
jgi:hypothetical protein